MATSGACFAVRGFEQAYADRPAMFIHPLDRVAVELKLADDGRREVDPGRAQRGKRQRLAASTPQPLERQPVFSLNERHQPDYRHRVHTNRGLSRSDRF